MISRGISSGRRALLRPASRSSTSMTSPSFNTCEGFVQVLCKGPFWCATSFGIWARLSSVKWAARKTSSRRPAPWAGVIWNVFSGTLFSFQPEMKAQAEDDAQDAEELGHGQAEKRRPPPEEEGVVRMIAPEVLGEEPDEGIVDDIKRKNLAVKGPAPQDHEEDEEVEEIQAGFEKLDGVDRLAQRKAREGLGVLTLEEETA